MGFPAGYTYTDVFFPKLFINILSLLSLIRTITLSLLTHLGLQDFLQPDPLFHDNPTRPEHPPLSAVIIRELLPVVKFIGDTPERCAVCLYEMENGEEVRWLCNCHHIFHRRCLDRWMDHDQKTCPLCRTEIVPRGMHDVYNQRLWAASGIAAADDDDDYLDDYNSVSGF